MIQPMVSLSRCALFTVAALQLGLALASAQEYAIGPADVLTITVWGQPDLSRDYPVDPDGSLAFPFLGRVRAAGLTTPRLAARLAELLEKDYLVDPQVSVTVKEYLSQKVQLNSVRHNSC
jgi:polysaccharide export outer membrane protein